MDWPAVAAISAVLASQAVWIGRALDSLSERIDAAAARLDRFEGRVEVRFDQVGARFIGLKPRC
jgi:hypothetical protein